MKVTLAPMEGVMDHHMRQLLTSIGGIDLCVAEFIRVIELKLPAKVFRRISPELDNGSKTLSGTPVRIQLLGQNPQCLAENANRAIQVGSDGIDLNFGCPAKAVNKSKGGAVLLKCPETLYNIVKEVRDAMPTHQLLSAKIRLGYEDKSLAIENAQVIKEVEAPYTWPQTLDLMIEYLYIQTYGDKEKYLPNRIKQWLTFMRLQQPQALVFLHKIRKIKTTQEMLDAIRHERLHA